MSKKKNRFSFAFCLVITICITAACTPNIDRLQKKGNVDALIELMNEEEDAEIRALSATALGVIGDNAAIEPLMNSLSDDDEFVREAAEDALLEFDVSASLPALMDGVNSPDADVRLGIVHALQQFKTEDLAIAAEPLIGCLDDENQVVREAVASILMKLDDSLVLPLLIDQLAPTETNSNIYIIPVLQQFETEALLSMIEPLMDSPSDENKAVCEVVLSLIEERLQNTDAISRIRGLHLIQEINPEASINAIILSLDDSTFSDEFNTTVKDVAMETLIAIGETAMEELYMLYPEVNSSLKEAIGKTLHENFRQVQKTYTESVNLACTGMAQPEFNQYEPKISSAHPLIIHNGEYIDPVRLLVVNPIIAHEYLPTQFIPYSFNSLEVVACLREWKAISFLEKCEYYGTNGVINLYSANKDVDVYAVNTGELLINFTIYPPNPSCPVLSTVKKDEIREKFGYYDYQELVDELLMRLGWQIAE